MSPETRDRLVNGLFAASIPVLAVTQIAFYSWSDPGSSLVVATFVHWPWWVAGLVTFVGLVVAAGIVASGEKDGQTLPAAHHRGMRLETRFRIAWILFALALVAYLFYRTAFRSWFASLPLLISYRFLSYQDWRWWIGALIACLGFLIAGAVVAAGGLKSRFPVTAIADPSHELRLDEHGNEIAPGIDPGVGAPSSYVPEPGDAPRPRAGRLEPSRPVDQAVIPWIRGAVSATVTLLAVHFWLVREIRADYVFLLAVAYAFGIATWWIMRAR